MRLPPGPGAANEEIIDVVQPDFIVIINPANVDEAGIVGPPDWLVFPKEQLVWAYQLDEAGEYQPSGEYAGPGRMPVATLPGLTIDWREVFDDVPP